jgi:hypothetical protein
MARNSPKSREVEERAAICFAVVDFFQRSQPSPLLNEMGQVIAVARDRKNLRGLNTLLRDLREWSTALSSDEQGRLDEELKSKFGKSLEEVSVADKLVQKILSAGQIKTDDEYEILERFVDGSSGSARPSLDVERANQLLVAYKAP